MLGAPTAQSSQVKSRSRLCTKFLKSAHKQKQKHPTHNDFPRSSARRKRVCLSILSTVQSSVCPCLDAHCTSQNYFLWCMRPSFSIFRWSLRPRYRALSSLSLAHRMSTRPLDFYAGPMVWIDCEMTGLDPRKDKVLEVAVRELLVLWQCIWQTIFLSGSHNERKPRPC